MENDKRKEAEENGIEDIQEECEISGDSLDSDSTQSTSSIPEYSATHQDMTNKSPVDFFRLLIPDPTLQQVVDQTNLYVQTSFFMMEMSHQNLELSCGKALSTIWMN